MRICAPGKIECNVGIKSVGETRRSCGYTLTEIYDDEVSSFGARVFLLYPSNTYVRTFPDMSAALVYRFLPSIGDRCLKLVLAENEKEVFR